MRKYVTCKPLLEHKEARFKTLFGGRDNGKSYTVKEHCLIEAVENGNQFAYVRRDELETKPAKVEQYFVDYDISALTDGKADKVSVYNGKIYLSKITENLSEKRVLEIGHVFWLGGAEHYKSLQYPKVTDLIYEEFLTDKGYDINESDNLQSIISTIFRSREGRIWLIGNTDSKFNPLLEEWGITKSFAKQKQGSTCVYDIGNNQKMVAYRAIEKTESKLTFRRKEVVEDGEWKVDKFNIMVYNKDKYFELFTIRYESIYAFNIKLCVYADTGKKFLFVYPSTLEHTNQDFILSVNLLPHENINVWNSFAYNENSKEIYALLRSNCVVFASNSCGTDFMQCLKIDGLI